MLILSLNLTTLNLPVVCCVFVQHSAHIHTLSTTFYCAWCFDGISSSRVVSLMLTTSLVLIIVLRCYYKPCFSHSNLSLILILIPAGNCSIREVVAACWLHFLIRRVEAIRGRS